MFKKIGFLLIAISIVFSADGFAGKSDSQKDSLEDNGFIRARAASKRNIETEKPAKNRGTNRFASRQQNLKKKSLVNNKKMVSREQTPKDVFLVNRKALAAKKQATQVALLAKKKVIAARTQTPKDSLLAKNRALAIKKQATQAALLAKRKTIPTKKQTPKDVLLPKRSLGLPKKPITQPHKVPITNNVNSFQSNNKGVIINKYTSRNGYSIINGRPMSENEKKEFEKKMAKFNKDMEMNMAKMNKMFEKDPFFRGSSGASKPASKVRKRPSHNVTKLGDKSHFSNFSSSNNGINMMSINGVTTVNGVRIPNKNGSTTIDKNTTAHVKDGLIEVIKKDSGMNSTTILNTKDYSVITAGPILKNGGPDFSKIGPDFLKIGPSR